MDFLQKRKINFSYEDLLNNFIDEIKNRLYTFEKIRIIKFINNWIIDLDRPSIIKIYYQEEILTVETGLLFKEDEDNL